MRQEDVFEAMRVGEKRIVREVPGGDWDLTTLRAELGAVRESRDAAQSRVVVLEREAAKWRDEANELEDCREALRRLGHFCGCDHVESADEREQQERHIEEAFMRLRDERDSFRDRVHELESQIAIARL